MKTLNTVFIRFLFVISSFMCFSQAHANSQSQDARMEQILAPIALYPDTVLSHILIASTYPVEVIQADRWAKKNPSLIGYDAVRTAKSQDWDPSVAALVAFPELLHRMAEDLQWTQNLGDLFLADETAVMSAIQHLRERAYASGNLNQAKHIKVIRENRVIYIEPSIERVVSLPYYDSRIVFGRWWWADYPPIFWLPPTHRRYVNHFSWGHRVNLSRHFYSSSIRWRDRRVVVHKANFRPKRYTNRHLARHNHATRWKHKPHHRRNVGYSTPRVRQRFEHKNTPRRHKVKTKHANSNHNRKYRSERKHRNDKKHRQERKHRNEKHSKSERRDKKRKIAQNSRIDRKADRQHRKANSTQRSSNNTNARKNRDYRSNKQKNEHAQTNDKAATYKNHRSRKTDSKAASQKSEGKQRRRENRQHQKSTRKRERQNNRNSDRKPSSRDRREQRENRSRQ